MRYQRQEVFFKLKGKQDILNKSKVTIIGLGALGCVVSELLIRAGVNLKLIDRDFIDESNLQRQNLFRESDIGKMKVKVAEERLKEINSEVKISSYVEDIDYKNVELLKNDLILDCTDNMETRFLINEYCLENKIPWIYASVLGSKGRVINFVNRCFKCIFNEPNESLGSCDTEGVLNSIVFVIAGIQVNEAIKILTKQDYEKDMILFDIWKNEMFKIKIKERKCLCNYEYLNGKKGNAIIKLCGKNAFMIKDKFNLEDLKKKLNVKENEYYLKNEMFTIFKDRVIINAESKEKAKALFDRYLK